MGIKERLFGEPKKKQLINPESSGRGNRLVEAVNQDLGISKGARRVHVENIEFGVIESGEAFFQLNDLRLGRAHYYESSQGELFYRPKNMHGQPIADLMRLATEAECALIVYAMRTSFGFTDRSR
jgi:hypothetical protein